MVRDVSSTGFHQWTALKVEPCPLESCKVPVVLVLQIFIYLTGNQRFERFTYSLRLSTGGIWFCQENNNLTAAFVSFVNTETPRKSFLQEVLVRCGCSQ